MKITMKIKQFDSFDYKPAVYPYFPNILVTSCLIFLNLQKDAKMQNTNESLY